MPKESEPKTISTLEKKYPINFGKLVVPENINKEDLNIQLNSLMQKAKDSKNKWICRVCGKTAATCVEISAGN